MQQEAERLLVEQLGLRQEAHAAVTAVGEVGERKRVEVRGVVAGEDHGSARRNEVRAFDGPSHPVVEWWQQDGASSEIHRFHGR